MENTEKKKAKLTKGDIVYYASLVSVCVIVLILKFIFGPVTVSGDSMYPSYKNKEIVLTNRFIGVDDIKRGCVVVFKGYETGNNFFIKRVVGLPGDKLEIIDGQLYVNGELTGEEYGEIKRYGCLEEPLIVGEGECFVMGDNRNVSNDSRYFGPIKLDEIRRVVTRKLISRG